jgi:hypothetical protein
MMSDQQADPLETESDYAVASFLRTRRAFALGTALLAVFGGLAIWIVTTELFPHHSLNHDEGVYLQQAAMLLEGQLTLRPPVEDVLRPWFFVEDGDRMYPKYAPVPAAMFALGELLGGYRLALVGITIINIALVVGVVDELFDQTTGLVAGVFVLCSPLFVIDSAVFLPYAPTTMLNLVFAYSYFRAERTTDRRLSAVAGGAIGIAFFARPFTAVLFALPFIVHALWTLYTDRLEALPRQLLVAALGLCGVCLAFGYNAAMTGSPFVFPYQAFAPLDGIGFGHREILAHEQQYTPRLALRANGRVVALFFTEWIAGGILGTALIGVGLLSVARGRLSARRAVLAGQFVTIIAGNVFFWGNFNILGDLDRAGDGLVSVFGPYYHFDLLVPSAAFAAVGLVWLARGSFGILADRFDARKAAIGAAVLVVVCVGVAGSVTAQDLETRVDENMEATNTYETVYEPFDDGPPENSLVLVPDPYGDWLNHPMQALRNDPDYDGRAVYAIHDHPFETAAAFPDRDLYRLTYRGAWNPVEGSPQAARLQRVHDVTGQRVQFNTTVGIPGGANGVTARVETDEGSVNYVAPRIDDTLTLTATFSGESVDLGGDFRPVRERSTALSERETVRVILFVDYGLSGGFSYRFDIPVETTDEGVRALSPRVEYCRNVRVCGGSATYIPELAPAGVSIETALSTNQTETVETRDRNTTPGLPTPDSDNTHRIVETLAVFDGEDSLDRNRETYHGEYREGRYEQTPEHG